MDQTLAPPEDPPTWAKELLQQQKVYTNELKKIRNELDAAKLLRHDKPGYTEVFWTRLPRPRMQVTMKKEAVYFRKVRLCF